MHSHTTSNEEVLTPAVTGDSVTIWTWHCFNEEGLKLFHIKDHQPSHSPVFTLLFLNPMMKWVTCAVPVLLMNSVIVGTLRGHWDWTIWELLTLTGDLSLGRRPLQSGEPTMHSVLICTREEYRKWSRIFHSTPAVWLIQSETPSSLRSANSVCPGERCSPVCVHSYRYQA